MPSGAPQGCTTGEGLNFHLPRENYLTLQQDNKKNATFLRISSLGKKKNANVVTNYHTLRHCHCTSSALSGRGVLQHYPPTPTPLCVFRALLVTFLKEKSIHSHPHPLFLSLTCTPTNCIIAMQNKKNQKLKCTKHTQHSKIGTRAEGSAIEYGSRHEGRLSSRGRHWRG